MKKWKPPWNILTGSFMSSSPIQNKQSAIIKKHVPMYRGFSSIPRTPLRQTVRYIIGRAILTSTGIIVLLTFHGCCSWKIIIIANPINLTYDYSIKSLNPLMCTPVTKMQFIAQMLSIRCQCSSFKIIAISTH